jgi:transposase
MIVGIDVHKRSHAAALVDERGAPIATLTIANSREGARRLRRWLSEHGAEQATIGVENAAGYGRLVCAVLAAAGHEVLNVPAWRVHRERPQQGPGKSDPGDALAIAVCVLRHREKLGPALEPPLIRAIAFLETHRRQSVTRRSDAIQRLRAVWAQVDPEAEARVPNIAAAKALRQLKQIELGNGLAEQAAARCIRDLAGEIEALNQRVAEIEAELQQLLTDTPAPFDDLPGVGLATTVTLIAQSGDVRRFRNDAAYARYGGAAPIPCGSGATAGRHRLHRGGNRQVNACLHRIAVTQARVDPNARAFLARKIAEGKTKREARRALKRHLSDVVYRRLHAWAEHALPPLRT